jgi:hypothetical protein
VAARQFSRALSYLITVLSHVSIAVEIEEVAGHMLQDQRLQTPKIEQAEPQGLIDGGREWA